jgi:hypothetical protein
MAAAALDARSLCSATIQSCQNLVSRQSAPNEYELRLPRHFRSPVASDVRAHHHMDTLEHHLLVQPVERDNALVAQQVWRMVRDQVAKECL